MRLKSFIAAVLCLSASVATVSARPLDVHVRVHRYHAYHAYRVRPHVRVASYLVRHGLLTPAQAACATLVPGRLGSRRVEHLQVYENYGGRCPGAPQPPSYLFDVYVDVVSGVVDTTPEGPDELQTVL